uniref:HD/PDEase domain-containing protein n=1 Tax=Paramormyrops kingsleyae TaxID=1676925 RepID=A0A3B3QTT1_9TELE
MSPQDQVEPRGQHSWGRVQGTLRGLQGQGLVSAKGIAGPGPQVYSHLPLWETATTCPPAGPLSIPGTTPLPGTVLALSSGWGPGPQGAGPEKSHSRSPSGVSSLSTPLEWTTDRNDGCWLDVCSLKGVVKNKFWVRWSQRISYSSQVFNDSIHGHIWLHPLLVRIINTLQFNRLRNLKQLGGTYFVYPGASHNRFEHSIGVAHLAGRLVRALRKQQPELGISPRDELCVQIAGLCHDLGKLCMLYALVSVPSEQKIYIFKQLIGNNGQWKYKGRPESKSFLYDIVANERNSIDVDKMDYFARDCHHLGIRNNFDFERFLMFARVCVVDGKKQICTRDKEAHNLYEMFHTRHRLHREAYKHRVVHIIQAMISEAFQKADKYIQISGSDGQMFNLSTAIDDMEAYTKLTDYVFDRILYSKCNNLADAQTILKKIVDRELYKCVDEIRHLTTKEIKEEMAICYVTRQKYFFSSVIQEIKMDYGMKEKNPINAMWFYRKNDPDSVFQFKEDEVSELLPKKFSEKVIRVFCKKPDNKSLDVAKMYFHHACAHRTFTFNVLWAERKMIVSERCLDPPPLQVNLLAVMRACHQNNDFSAVFLLIERG